ncbi:MAG: restriction endonuclease subunit S [Candidatus Moeniiplasma glomeromycotorum]|nr:restriction endonuclease subunit S [Candidatus Moeniiplasma glomeromycotorum]MCE8169174.1 restriction endonuclease subunit S [Candidatus Moeniiplasma glomeromycotorum]
MTQISKFKIKEIFSVKQPLNCDKKNLEVVDVRDSLKNVLPFLGRSKINNGITDFVKVRENLINEGGVITVALDGSTGATFYQHHKFISGQNIWVLRPLASFVEKLTPKAALFLATIIQESVRNYSYNLSLTKNRLGEILINVPTINENEKKLDIRYVEEIYSKISHKELLKKIPQNASLSKKNIENVLWKGISVKELFKIVKRSNTKTILSEVNFDENSDIAVFSAGGKNFRLGVSGWISSDKISNFKKGECILVNNNGSIGYSRYWEGKFVATSDVTILSEPKKLIETEAHWLLITAILSKTLQKKFKDSYNLKLTNKRLEDTIIRIPFQFDNNIIEPTFIDFINKELKDKKKKIFTT